MNSEFPVYLHVKVIFNGNELYTCGFDETEILIGRGGDCQVLLENAGVSRHHAKLVREGDKVKVVDLQSGNGTFVNGKQISEVLLGSAETLRIGKFSLYVSLSPEAPDASQPPPSPGLSDAGSGTVFLRPDERAKILQQAQSARQPERITVPTAGKKPIDRANAVLFFGLGTLFGLFCSWLFSG